MPFCVIATPLGPMRLTEEDGALTEAAFLDLPLAAPATPLLREAARQLCAYFDGTLRTFSLPLKQTGSPFRLRCWQALTEIPYGETISYGEQARRIGQPGASRAVGGANHHNPICVIVPCHRVIGADGSLTGYGGGVHIKAWLLAHEKQVMEE